MKFGYRLEVKVSGRKIHDRVYDEYRQMTGALDGIQSRWRDVQYEVNITRPEAKPTPVEKMLEFARTGRLS